MIVDLAQAIALLKRGEIVAIPTETVYGLAADARNEHAIEKIYAKKQRPTNNPLIVHIADSEQVLGWATDYPPLAQKFAQAFWPGPLTLVLPAKDTVPSIVRANEPTVALRVPAHPLARQLLLQSRLGLAAPSANRYTQISPTTAQHVADSLGKDLPVLDGGACQIGIESTIVAIQNNQWQMLRLGMITASQLEAVAEMSEHKTHAQPPKAPGQHRLHYAPTTPVILFESATALSAFAESQKDCALLRIGAPALSDHPTFFLPNNAAGAAEKLYDVLRQMDALKMAALLIELPPKTQPWLAIRDRLQRASQKL